MPERVHFSTKQTAMNRENRLSTRFFRWLRRWRHRCGYGVHSPFAFSLISGVIYESAPYYAYAALRKGVRARTPYGAAYDAGSGMLEKDLRLLFRLANFCHPHRIVVQGGAGMVEAYLRAAGLRRQEGGDEVVLVYADAPAMAQVDELTDGSMLIVRNIHRDAEALDCWKRLAERADVTLTFDLGRFGLAIRNDKLNKQGYIVDFF